MSLTNSVPPQYGKRVEKLMQTCFPSEFFKCYASER